MRQSKYVPGGRCPWNTLDAQQNENCNVNRIPMYGTPEQIEMCLSCEKKKCVNCFSPQSMSYVKRSKKTASERYDLQLLCDCYNKSLSVKETVKKMGISKATVTMLRRKCGMKRTLDANGKAIRHKFITPEDLAGML
jgi:predicted DNA-binding protein (UPF0251 family)